MTYTKKQLMSLPKRLHEDGETGNIYDSIIILNSKKKYKYCSGLAVFIVIGCIKGEPIEIINDYCNSIFWKNDDEALRRYVPLKMYKEYPSGAVRFFGHFIKFKIGDISDTVEIQIIEQSEQK